MVHHAEDTDISHTTQDKGFTAIHTNRHIF